MEDLLLMYRASILLFDRSSEVRCAATTEDATLGASVSEIHISLEIDG